MASQEVITRRNLPHWYVPGAAHFITYRLWGTLDSERRQELTAHKESLLGQGAPPGTPLAQYRATVHKRLFGLYDSQLDGNRSIRWLADPQIAALIRSNLYHHDGGKYHLLAYCIMPNHVHVLLQSIDLDQSVPGLQSVGESADTESPLSVIMHSLKSYTAHEANKILRRTGTFWEAESYDHWVRDEIELERIVDYITANPIKARLVSNAQDWYFCSCHDRFLTAGEVSGWLPVGS
jgi:putative DNA methylase